VHKPEFTGPILHIIPVTSGRPLYVGAPRTEESVRRERIIVCRNNDAECYELLHKTYDLNLST